MTDLRKLSEAEWADAPGTPEYIRAATECYSQFRSGSLIPLSEYERVLALLAEAREALRIAKRAQAAIDDAHDQDAGTWGLGRLYEAEQIVHAAGNAASATLSRINDALAAEPEAKA